MNWTTKKIKISELKPLKNNPRKIEDEEYNKLDRSVGDLGNFKPLIVDFDLTIIGGNQRYEVLKSNGFEEVEVSVPERKLKKKEKDKIVLLDNLHSGEFDMDLLASDFAEAIEDLELDFDFEETDFSDKNKEVDIDTLEEDRKIIFKINNDDLYFQLLELIANGVSKGGFSTNEEYLIYLLQKDAKT